MLLLCHGRSELNCEGLSCVAWLAKRFDTPSNGVVSWSEQFENFKNIECSKNLHVCFNTIIRELNIVFLTGVDAMVEADPTGDLVFSIIGMSRAVQGVCAGMLFVIVRVSLT